MNNEDVVIAAGGCLLEGRLQMPEKAAGLVVFVHGSGSSRFSPRNRGVAQTLNDAGLGTLLFDLLSREEHERDALTAEYRFDIPLLAARLQQALAWLARTPTIRSYPLGLFGASTGAAAALIMLGLAYASEAARGFAQRLMQLMRDAAYSASVELAGERGAFPDFDADDYLQSGFARRLPEELRSRIFIRGIRNSHLLAIAPTGTISLLANNISSGIEPVFDFHVRRRVRNGANGSADYPLTDYAWRLWQEQARNADPGPAFVTATQVSADAQLEMLAALQPYVDNAISKTINLDRDDAGQVAHIFAQAAARGLKGCTVYRQGARHDVITSASPDLVFPVDSGEGSYDR